MTKKIQFTGGWGARYGRKLRYRTINAIKKMKGWQICPYCKKERVKRFSFGVWQCRACDSKFTGKAYEV
ncbi:MAG: 50S ribosomal protein L37ae [Nanoarchaeota archaeon]